MKFMARAVILAINDVHSLLDITMQLYSQQLRPAGSAQYGRLAQIRDQIHENIFNWMRTTRRCNWGTV